jgi:uncharacterized membrane protein
MANRVLEAPGTAPSAATHVAPTPAPARAKRLESVDLLRGVVMILMALDHTRDYFGSLAANPTDLAATTVPLFFTRWVTHFCAPTFFFLTGTGAYLSQRRRGKEGLSRFLLTRGVWMIALDVVVLRCLAWQFNFDFQVTFLIVLWALGWAMITLSALVRWPPWIAASFGIVLVAGHNLLDGVNPSALGPAAPLWLILHRPGLLHGSPHFVLVAYPLIPWVGVTAVGYALGQVFDWDTARRRAFLWRTGAALTLGFVALRWLNVYGDPSRWSSQRTGVFTILSFLNTTKYPPSLLFLLMTLGPALLFLRFADDETPRALRPALEFGRVPLFYFAMHVVLIHVLALVVCWYRYGSPHWVFESPRPDLYPFAQPPGWPLSLAWVYVIWLGVVATLWPVCRWYASLKRRRRDWWLSYL